MPVGRRVAASGRVTRDAALESVGAAVAFAVIAISPDRFGAGVLDARLTGSVRPDRRRSGGLQQGVGMIESPDFSSTPDDGPQGGRRRGREEERCNVPHCCVCRFRRFVAPLHTLTAVPSGRGLAVIGARERYTYDELHGLANQIAHAEDLVGEPSLPGRLPNPTIGSSATAATERLLSPIETLYGVTAS